MQYILRLLIIGDSTVGKTSLLIRYNENVFNGKQKATIGVDYKTKKIKIDDNIVNLQLWDTAGQERFRSMTTAFFKKAQGVAVVFDVTQKSSFESVSAWIDEVKQNTENCSIVICANKVDLPVSEWQVTREEFLGLASSYGYPLFECSSLSGVNIEVLFDTLVRDIITTNSHNCTIVCGNSDGKTDESKLLGQFTKKKQENSCC